MAPETESSRRNGEESLRKAREELHQEAGSLMVRGSNHPADREREGALRRAVDLIDQALQALAGQGGGAGGAGAKGQGGDKGSQGQSKKK